MLLVVLEDSAEMVYKVHWRIAVYGEGIHVALQRFMWLLELRTLSTQHDQHKYYPEPGPGTNEVGAMR